MVDAHCHLDQYKDPDAVARAADKSGVTIIAVTALPSHFEQGYSRVHHLRRVRLALGLHPLLAERHPPELAAFERLLDKTSYVGEIGLDCSREGIRTYRQQETSLRFVFERLGGRRKFISLHSRRAERAVMALLDEYSVGPAVFHWYTGPLKLALQAADRGHFFSINHAMLQSARGLRLLRQLSPSRVLTETDGPFIRVGNRAIKPSDVVSLGDELAALWRVSVSEVRSQLRENIRSVTDGLADVRLGNG